MESVIASFASFAETSFPVAVAAYLLIRTESRIADLTLAIVELRHLLEPRD